MCCVYGYSCWLNLAVTFRLSSSFFNRCFQLAMELGNLVNILYMRFCEQFTPKKHFSVFEEMRTHTPFDPLFPLAIKKSTPPSPSPWPSKKPCPSCPEATTSIHCPWRPNSNNWPNAASCNGRNLTKALPPSKVKKLS